MFGKFVIAYLDDILIYSPSKPIHATHVKQVLTHLLENQLFMKVGKCEFHISSILFLGCIFNPDKVLMDQSKVVDVKKYSYKIVYIQLYTDCSLTWHAQSLCSTVYNRGCTF